MNQRVNTAPTGSHGSTDKSAPPPVWWGDFVALVDAFGRYKLHNENKSASTVVNYRRALMRLGQYAGSVNPLKLRAGDVEIFAGAWLHSEGFGSSSRTVHVAAVREWYEWLVRKGDISASPAAALPYPKRPKSLPRVMSLRTLEKLLQEPDISTFAGLRDSVILHLLASTGMRVSGLVSLNQGALVQHTIDGRERLVLRVIEKGNRERFMPLSVEADFMLRIYLESPELAKIDRAITRANGEVDQVLFVSVQNQMVAPHKYVGEARRITRVAIFKMIRRHGLEAGLPIDQLHPHALRHLFGTELAESDVGDSASVSLMGHGNNNMLPTYQRMSVRKLTRELDRANPLSKINTPAGDIIARFNGKKSK